MMTPEQQQRLRAALVSDEAFLEFLTQEADSSEFQAAQQRVEAGPHPADTLLHEYVFGWLDTQEAARIRDHLICCRTCAEEVLRFRQFEEQRDQATQAWLADAAQTSQVEAAPAASAKSWWSFRTILQFGAMLAAVLMLVYPHAIIEILLQIPIFTRQQTAIGFGILLIGLFALALGDLYRHHAPRFASGGTKALLSGLCMLAFLAFMLPTIQFIGDFAKPPIHRVIASAPLMPTPTPGYLKSDPHHKSIPLPAPIPKPASTPITSVPIITMSRPISTPLPAPIPKQGPLPITTMPGPDRDFAIEAVGGDYSDVFSYLMAATNLLDPGVFFAFDNYEWDSYVQSSLRVNDTTTSDSLISDDVLNASYADMIDLDESLSLLSSVIVVSETWFNISFCAEMNAFAPISEPAHILVRKRATVMLVGIGLLALLGLAAKKIQRS